MTNIEFKVQFVSGSFGGKGSCKGIVLGGTWRAKDEVEGAGGEVHAAGSTRVISSYPTSKDGGWLSMTGCCPKQLESSHKGRPGPSHISQHPEFSYIQMSLRADLETDWCQPTVPPSRVSSGLHPVAGDWAGVGESEGGKEWAYVCTLGNGAVR